MLGLSDARRFRRLAAGLCSIAAPIVLLVGAPVHPTIDDDAAAHLAVVSDDPDRYFATHAILLVGLALFLTVVLGLVHLLRERMTAFGHIGGGLALIGLLGATAVVAVDGIAVSQMGQPEARAEEMTALLDRIKESAGLRGVAVVGAVGFLLGMLLLAYGLWRARAVQPWTASTIAAAAIALFIGQATDSRIIFAIAFAVYLVALVPLGWSLLSESDEKWAANQRAATPASPTNSSA